MSLPARERRKLRAIERAEAWTDPGLAARFSIFNQLSRHEDMPRTERLKAREIRRMNWAERAITAYLTSDRTRYEGSLGYPRGRTAPRWLQPPGAW
jgi:hypothetical protein